MVISVILLGVWLWELGQKRYIHLKTDICFTFVYGPFARKINSIFAARGWGKDSVLFKPHSMNLKRDISSDCLKYFSQFVSMWKIYAG